MILFKVLLLAIISLPQTSTQICSFQSLRQYNLIDYEALKVGAHLILNFEPNHNYLNQNISRECYVQSYVDNGKSCPELIHNESYNLFFLYRISAKFVRRFQKACKRPYRACFAFENYENYNRSFFDCHDDQSDIFVYMGEETLLKVEENFLLQYLSKRTYDATLYQVSPESILERKVWLYKVTISENEMVSHDANICHSVIVQKYPIKRILCFY